MTKIRSIELPDTADADYVEYTSKMYKVTHVLDFTSKEPEDPYIDESHIALKTGNGNITNQKFKENYMYKWNGSVWNEYESHFIPYTIEQRLFDLAKIDIFDYRASRAVVPAPEVNNSDFE